MTLMETESGLTRLVSKAAAADEAGTTMLLRIALYDTLGEMADAVREYEEARVSKIVAERSEEGRRALVKTYIQRRAEGGEVGDILKAASMMTLVEVEKAQDDDPSTWWWDKKGDDGRFVARNAAAATRARDSAGGRAVRGAQGVLNAAEKETYDEKLKAGGQLLAATHLPGVRPVGLAAQAAGVLGPQAERVLGPGLQRAAYRYRGTERRPSKALLEAQQTYGVTEGGRNGEPISGVIPYYRAQQDMSLEAKQMGVRGDSAAAALRSYLPTQEQAELSLASGRVPPSRGVIIDADGDLITEAVGMNGDHYVPFDLKNLARLEGGQYVRTRAAGGPTREDLYTGLLSGARQVQVVSHSGVFTIELDPDLRGGRRYSDKARGMVQRYQQILETVNSGKVAEVELDSATRAQLRETALARANTPAEAGRIYRELEQNKLAEISFLREEQDNDELDEYAENQVATYERQQGKKYPPSERRRVLADVRRQAKQKGIEGTPRALRLDGEGYRRALESLRAEYPQFIREVRVETLREFEDNRGLRTSAKQPMRAGVDRGFVSSGSNLQAGSSTRDRRADRGSRPESRPERREESGDEEPSAQPRAAASGSVSAPTGAPNIRPDLPAPNAPSIKAYASDAEDGLADSVKDDVTTFIPVVAKIHEENDDYIRDNGKNQSGAAYVDWYFRFNHGDNAKGAGRHLLSKATPEELAKLKKELKTASKDVQHEAGRPSGVRGAEDADVAIISMIETIEALQTGPAFDLMKAVEPVDEDSVPFSFPEIDRLGVSSANIKAYTAKAAAADPDGLGNLLKAPGPSEARDQVANMVNQISRLRRWKKGDGSTLASDEADRDQKIAQLAKLLPKAHLAWSLRHAERAAAVLRDRAGESEEGEESPDPTEARETVSARDPLGSPFSKRSVRVHPLGTPLAIEFAKFVRERR